MLKKDRIQKQIRQHGANLNAIFQTEFEDTILYQKLRRIELKASRVQTAYCNGEISMEERNIIDEQTEAKLDKILRYKAKNIPVFINGDPRGYTLKIHDNFVRYYALIIYTDWGGYGILAPEFDGR